MVALCVKNVHMLRKSAFLIILGKTAGKHPEKRSRLSKNIVTTLGFCILVYQQVV